MIKGFAAFFSQISNDCLKFLNKFAGNIQFFTGELGCLLALLYVNEHDEQQERIYSVSIKYGINSIKI